MDMAIDGNLAGDDDIAACSCRACNARLTHNEIVVTNLDAVGDLYEVVDLGAMFDDGVAKTCSVNGCIGSNFNVIFDDDTAELIDLGVFAIG